MSKIRAYLDAYNKLQVLANELRHRRQVIGCLEAELKLKQELYNKELERLQKEHSH